MPNIAVALRQEIIRLAGREIRSQTLALRKSAAQFRRDIAELKRQASRLNSEVAHLERQVGRDVAPKVAEAGSATVRFTAKGVISQRKRLGISAADYGKLIGVTGHTIYKWEHRTSRPRKAQLSVLGSLRTLGKREALTRLEQLRENAPKRRTGRR